MGKRNKVTTRDIAEYTGVSQSTVSMILSKKPHVSFSTETVDKVFLAVIPCGVGDFTHRLPGGGEKVFCPVDTAQDDVFIGRVAGAGIELPGKVGRA